MYQAGLTAQGCWDEMDEYNRTAILKFAELIVRECIEQGKMIQSHTIVNGSEEYVAGREMGIEVFMNQIKQHFGVEG
jgi:hypothetical protein